jgi:hypothetical protein
MRSCQAQFAKFLHRTQNSWGEKTTPSNSPMPKPPSKSRKKVVWRVRVLMAERDIRSVSELVRRLDRAGVFISVAQLGRLIDGKTAHWNQEVIEGLMAVFDCGEYGLHQ